MIGHWAQVKRLVKPNWLRLAGGACLLFGASGCAGFWEELMSHERDWKYVWGRDLPDPLVVLRDSDDGVRKQQALLRLKEPQQNGGDALKQDAYLEVLSRTAKDDHEPLCRLAAVRTLGNYRDPRAARVLEDVYKQPNLPFNTEYNGMIRKESLVALEKSHDPEARSLLISVARQPGPTPEASQSDRLQTQEERMVALRALGNYRDNQECADALAEVLRKEKDIALRHLALASLKEISGKEWPEPYEAWQREDLRPQPGLANGNNNFIQQVSGIFKK